jgi:RHS repeat-associated protein
LTGVKINSVIKSKNSFKKTLRDSFPPLNSTEPYYKARYCDTLIGRFISPDTIIPRPANPQSFNRYSYCLNNPLKYIDPNGQKVYIPGIGDVENITMDSWIWLMHMTPEARGEVLTLLGAYESFREYHPEQAAKLEGLNETVNIEFGETNHPYQDSIMQENNGEYTITMNQSLIYADNFYQAGAILSASYDIAFPLSERDLYLIWYLPNLALGTAELVVGVPMAIAGTVLTIVAVIPGAAVAEIPVIVTGGAAIMGLMLCVDGLYRVSDGNINIDLSWLQWPF